MSLKVILSYESLECKMIGKRCVQRHIQAKLWELPYTDHSLYVKLHAQSLAHVISLIPQTYEVLLPPFYKW